MYQVTMFMVQCSLYIVHRALFTMAHNLPMSMVQIQTWYNYLDTPDPNVLGTATDINRITNEHTFWMASSTPLRTRTKSSSESVATCKEVKYSLNFSTFNCLRWWQLMMTTSPPLKLTKWWNDYYEMDSAQKKNSLEVQQAAQECQVNGQSESWKHVVHFWSCSRCSKSFGKLYSWSSHSENLFHLNPGECIA